MTVEILLDGRIMTDREALHTHLAEKLSLPDYYGRNLDALFDLLSVYPQSAEIVLVHADVMIAALGRYGHGVLKTMVDASRANPNLEFTLSNEIL